MTHVLYSKSGRRQRGSITLAALILVVPLLVMAFAYLSIATRNTIEQDMRCPFRAAEELAQSGIDRALLELVNDPTFERGSRQLDNGAVTYSVVSRWNESDSRFVRIVATGFTNPRVDELGNLVASPASARRSLVAVARERIYDYDVKQALLLSDPNAQMEITGSDLKIQGQDRNYSDHQPGTDGGRPGIAVTGQPSALASQLALSQCLHIQGLGGTPSIVQRAVAPDLVEKLISYYHSAASIRF